MTKGSSTLMWILMTAFVEDLIWIPEEVILGKFMQSEQAWH